MIKHEDLMEGLNNPELSRNEKVVLAELEKLTDGIIKERFDGTNSVYIDSSLIDNILSDLKGTRLKIVREKWIANYCTEGGWNIRYSSDRDGGTYVISPLTQQEKILIRSSNKEN